MTHSSSQERDLCRHVTRCSINVKIKYIETWHYDFKSIKSRNKKEAVIILGGYLLTISDGYSDVLYIGHDKQQRCDPSWGILMGDQIEFAGTHVNFLFKVCFEGRYLYLAVTIDEDNRHHRSPENITRDRILMDNGCKVINFTEDDAMARPEAISDEISSHLGDLTDTLLTQAGLIRGPRPDNIVSISSMVNTHNI